MFIRQFSCILKATRKPIRHAATRESHSASIKKQAKRNSYVTLLITQHAAQREVPAMPKAGWKQYGY